jgi:hypothetical protein
LDEECWPSYLPPRNFKSITNFETLFTVASSAASGIYLGSRVLPPGRRTSPSMRPI